MAAFECKLSDRPRFEDARSLDLFLSDYPECACGGVMHTGSDIVRLGERVIALPWTLLAAS